MKFHHVFVCLALLLFAVSSAMTNTTQAEDLSSPALSDASTLANSEAENANSSVSDSVVAVYGEKFRKVPTGDRKLIVLSFDDGPHPTRTAQVMAILKENDVPANFFWIGRNVRQYPGVARQVAKAGYEIGNHSMTHPNLRKQSIETVRKEIGDNQKLIEETIGYRPHLFRPPGGFVDREVQQVCRENELAICLWSVDPKDWARDSTPQSVHAIVLKTAHAGAIICMHDIHADTIEALPSIIRDLKAKGYEFTTISHLLESRDESSLAVADAPAGSAGAMGGMDSSPLTISLEDSDI